MDRYLVKVSGKAWHTGCLKCCMCGLELGKEATCYTKEDKIYCKTDYARFVYFRVHWLWCLCKRLCLVVVVVHLLRASYSREHVYRSLPRSRHKKMEKLNKRSWRFNSKKRWVKLFLKKKSCLPLWCLNSSRYKALGKKSYICWSFILITFSGYNLP